MYGYVFWHVFLYVLVCINLARIDVRIDNGTYCMYWYVLVRMASVYLYVFISAGIGRYWHVSVRIACIGMYGMYCMYWYVYVCICMYWYVLVCNLACILVRIGMYEAGTY